MEVLVPNETTRPPPRRVTAGPPVAPPLTAPRTAPRRQASLDTLRGFAIALMAVDHAAKLFLVMRVEPWNIRFATRLSEPLFAVLLGYFLLGRPRMAVARRAGHVLVAAIVVNAFYTFAFFQVEILGTFLVVIALYLALGRHLVWLTPLFLVAALDPTRGWLNYPLFVVASQVAFGMLLRRGASPWLVLAFAVAWFTVPLPTTRVALFTIPAVLLVVLARRFPTVEIRGLTTIGRYPLTAYVAQWAVLVGLAIAWGLAGGRSAWLLERLDRNYWTLWGLYMAYFG